MLIIQRRCNHCFLFRFFLSRNSLALSVSFFCQLLCIPYDYTKCEMRAFLNLYYCKSTKLLFYLRLIIILFSIPLPILLSSYHPVLRLQYVRIHQLSQSHTSLELFSNLNSFYKLST